MIKSPLRYPGGKSRAVEYLYRFVPSFSEFREPFFGGGSFTFYCMQKKPSAGYQAGEINHDLFCFWNELKFNSERLIQEILDIKSRYDDGRKLFNDLLDRRHRPLTDLQRAVDFFILNRITFSGVVDSGGYSEQAFRKRFTLSSIERLRMIHPLTERITFSWSDYTELLFREGTGVFIFLDPPYYSATPSKLYGKKGCLHTSFDHDKFHQHLKQCHHRWMITYDNCDYIRDIYKSYYQVEWELQYGMNNYKKPTAQKGRELLIANYDLKKVFEREQMLLFDKSPLTVQRLASE